MTVISTTSQEALPYAAGATYVTFLTQMPPDIVLGAFAGSVIFLLGVNNKPKWQWLIYFLIAFLAGLLGAKPVAGIGEGMLGLVGIQVQLSHGLGAMFAAACTINVISWFRDNPSVLLQRLKKGGNA
jgi:hypothetical protein